MTRQKSLTVEISYLLDLLTIYNMTLFYFEKNDKSDIGYIWLSIFRKILGQLSAIKLAKKSMFG